MAVQLAPLYPGEIQFQAKDGSNNTAGFLRVYLAATDDPAETFSDYVGTRNPDKIILDDNGRAVVICDKAKAYRLEVYDADGMLLWTEEPVFCSGTGGGGVSVTTVESTDGSIAVESAVVGSNRIYDLSIAPDNAKELLEWVKTDNEAVSDGPVRPNYVEGTMDVYSGQGIEVSDTGLYHVTVNLGVTPSGNGINYETLSVFLMLDDGSDTPIELCKHDFDVDNSVSDKVELEFAYDLTGKGDGKLYLVVSGATPFQNVDVSLQMHRVYSGIAAVPGSIASRVWVEENISSKIDYSALEYNNQNLITGISGSAIAANSVDPNEYVPWSASGVFQPSGNYLSATDSALFQPSGQYLSASESSNYYPMTGNPSGFLTDDEGYSSFVMQSAFSSYSADVDSSITSISSFVSGLTGTYIEQSASGMFQPSGNYVSSTDMSAYVPFSSIDGVSGQVTAINESAIRGHEYSGVYPIGVDNTADTVSIDTVGFGVDNVTITATADENGVVIGVADNLYQPSGQYLSATESANYYPTSNPSGFISGVDLTPYQKTADMSAYQLSGDYAYNSAVSGKLDESAYATASGNFLTAVPDGYATESYVDSGLSGKLDVTASSLFITSLPADLATTADVASAVSGKMDDTERSAFYPSTSNPSGYLTAHQSLAGYATEQYVDSSVSGKLDSTAYDSAQFLLTSQSGLFQPSGYYQPSGEYLSATESSNYYPTSNPSGFISGVDLSPYQKTADMTAYQPSGDYQTAGNYLSATDSAEFLLTSQSGMFAPSGNYQPSGDYLSATESSNYYPTSNPSGFISGVDLSPYQLTADMSAYQPSGNYQTAGNYLSSTDSAEFIITSQSGMFQPSGNYLSATESSNYYSTSNPSGFITGVDLTPYQQTADMTGYIPVSALGTGEI